MLYLKEGHKALSAVIFDLGEVLFEFDPRRFCFEMGFDAETSERVIAVTVKNPVWVEVDRGTQTIEDLIADAGRKEPLLRKEIRRFVETWPQHFHAIIENVETFYRVKESGVKVYILSNIPVHVFEYAAAHNEFLHDFDGKILSAACHLMKPGKEIFDLLISQYGLDPSSSAFFDDIEANAEGARAVGLLGVHLPARGSIADYLEFDNTEKA